MPRDQAMRLLVQHGLDTRESALDRYVSLVVGKWGEGERSAARRQRSGQSHGLIANAVVHFDVDAIDPALSAAVDHLLTPADRADLRRGG